DLRNDGFGERFCAGICDHADDCGPGRWNCVPKFAVSVGLREKTDALADRVLVRPEHARRGLVDDSNAGSIFQIAMVEETSTVEGHAEEMEIFGRDDGVAD